jgi:hypothetical protein
MSIGWPDLASGTLLALPDNADSGTQALAFSSDPDTPNSTWSVTSVDPDGTPTDDDRVWSPCNSSALACTSAAPGSKIEI